MSKETLSVVNLAQRAAALTEHWSPKVVGRVNDQYIKVAKVRGELAWHKHDDEDELFLVLAGRLRLDMEDGAVELGPGDCYVMPKGVVHRPVALAECLLALVETVTTKHTGDVVTAQTKSIDEQLG